MDNIKRELEIIKEAILREVPALRIYLFGSYAYGTPNEESDIDIYVVLPDSFNRDILFTGAIIITYLLDKISLDVDLKMRKEDFFNLRKKSYSFEKRIFEKGILLYGN